MPTTSRTALKAALGLVTATALAVLPVLSASAHDGDSERLEEMSLQGGGGLSVPVATSDNIELLDTVPKPGAIAGVFSPSAPYFYVSTLESIDVYDVRDPRHPVLTGTLPQVVFENEAMNYGERTNAQGKTTRFVLIGVDLTQASSDDPQHNNLDGASEVIVVDVTDPAKPSIRSRTPATTSTHTVACVDVRNCKTAYTAGSRPGLYSIIDLDSLSKPREVDARPRVAGQQAFPSPASGPAARLSAATSGTSTRQATDSIPEGPAQRSSTSHVPARRSW